MHNKLTKDQSFQLIQTIMLNHLYGWLKHPMNSLLDRKDIIRFCCCRSWQTSHILQFLFAINQIGYINNYKHIINEINALQIKPTDMTGRLMALACSGDFIDSVNLGILLIKDLIKLADIHYPKTKADTFFRISSNDNKKILSFEQKVRIAESLSETYKAMQGIELVVFEGSLATGNSDALSDIDLIAYCNHIPDIELRRAKGHLVDLNSLIIPESDRLTIDGVYVHTDFELISKVEKTFDDFPQSICMTLVLWEPIQSGKVLWDPRAKFPKWKQKLSNISKEFRNRLISQLLKLLQEEKRQFDIAVRNNDLMYCSMILGNILVLYFQALGIINNRFIFSPKWLQYTLQGMNLKPRDAYDRFISILTNELNNDSLRIMTDKLRELIDDLEDVYKKHNLLA